MSLTLQTWNLPSPNHLSGNQPVLMIHPRINSRSEQSTLHCDRTPLTMNLPCLVFVLLLLPCIYCFFPLSYCPVVSTSAADAPVIDYFVDDRTSPVELPGKQSHFPSPNITYLFRTFLALGICCCYVTILFNCIACHCHP